MQKNLMEMGYGKFTQAGGLNLLSFNGYFFPEDLLKRLTDFVDEHQAVLIVERSERCDKNSSPRSRQPVPRKSQLISVPLRSIKLDPHLKRDPANKPSDF